MQVHRTAWSGQFRVAAISSMLLPEARYRSTSRSSFVSAIATMQSSRPNLSMTLAPFNCKVPVFHELLIDREEARTLRAASKRMGDDSAVRARWSDAWILAAVDWAADADLAKIIAAADAINHAIPTIEEVEHAIQFLGAAGLVRYSDNSLQLTDEGRRVCKRTETKDIFTTLDRLHAFLKKLPEVNDASNAESVLDRSTYLSALERYETAIAEELPELYGRGTSSGNRDADDGSSA